MGDTSEHSAVGLLVSPSLNLSVPIWYIVDHQTEYPQGTSWTMHFNPLIQQDAEIQVYGCLAQDYPTTTVSNVRPTVQLSACLITLVPTLHFFCILYLCQLCSPETHQVAPFLRSFVIKAINLL